MLKYVRITYEWAFSAFLVQMVSKHVLISENYCSENLLETLKRKQNSNVYTKNHDEWFSCLITTSGRWYWNNIGKIVVKAVPNPVKQMSKTILRHTLIKKNSFHIFVDFLICIHFHYMKMHRLSSSLQRRTIFRQDLGIEI